MSSGEKQPLLSPGGQQSPSNEALPDSPPPYEEPARLGEPGWYVYIINLTTKC